MIRVNRHLVEEANEFSILDPSLICVEVGLGTVSMKCKWDYEITIVKPIFPYSHFIIVCPDST